MQKHIIMIDLDGTLLNDKRKISDKNKKVIKQVQTLGHIVVISTGRAHYRSHMYYEELQLESLFVNRNGCFIHGPYDDNFNHVYEWIDKTTVHELLLGEAKQYMDKIYLEHLNEVYVIKGERDFYERYPLCTLNDFNKQPILETTNLISIHAKNEHLIKIKQIIESFGTIKYEEYPQLEMSIFNIYPYASDKANAFAYLSQYYDVPHERIISIGDNINDVKMVKEAGIGVAMENAINEVKNHAKFITEYNNDESGVGLFLKEYFKI